MRAKLATKECNIYSTKILGEKKNGEDDIFFLNTIQGKACFDFPKKLQNEEKFTTLNRQM